MADTKTNIPKTDAEKLAHFEEALKKMNGVNVIVENANGDILTGRSTYGEKKLMLPGGGIERGELSKHAASSEAEEETGIIIQEEDVVLIGYFIQRLRGVPASGFLFLYHCTKYVETEHIAISDPELVEVRFRSIDEILEAPHDFGLGYIRMILQFLRIKNGFDTAPFEGKLSDKVNYVYNGKLISI